MNLAQPQTGVAWSAPPARQASRSPHGFATGIVLLYLFLITSRGVELLSRLVAVCYLAMNFSITNLQPLGALLEWYEHAN
jgi:hypothetical protein